MTGHIAAALFEICAVTFLVAVVLTVRKARARGKRLFVDGPTKRSKALSADTRMDHTQDAL